MTSMKQHLCRELMTSMRGVMKLLVLSRAMDLFGSELASEIGDEAAKAVEREEEQQGYGKDACPELAIDGIVLKPSLSACHHAYDEQGGCLEESSSSPCPGEAEDLSVP